MKHKLRIEIIRFTPINTLALFSLFIVSLVVTSVIRSHNITYLLLVWNLFLAWVPFLIAYIWFKRLEFEKPLKPWKSILLSGIWLLFFPNAPYLITDLIHLSGDFNPAFWTDTLLFFGAAMNGLILGVYSLHFIHKALIHFTNKKIAWGLVGMILVATGFGIFLGRVQRWNSWDLFVQPYSLLKDAIFSLKDPLAIKMTIGFSVLMFIVYIVLKTIISHESDQKQS
jgi:uncharacterized membrane protein